MKEEIKVFQKKARKIDYILKNTSITFRKHFDYLISEGFISIISRFLENPETKNVLTLSVIPGYDKPENVEAFIEEYRNKFKHMNKVLIENEVAPIFPNPDNVTESEKIRQELIKEYPEDEVNAFFKTESYSAYERPIYKPK